MPAKTPATDIESARAAGTDISLAEFEAAGVAPTFDEGQSLFRSTLAQQSAGPLGNLPMGVREVIGGRSPKPLAGRLLRQAGLALPSAQAWRNLSPDDRAVYTDLAQRAGIPETYFQQELATAAPSGGGGRGRARMLPLATRRVFR